MNPGYLCLLFLINCLLLSSIWGLGRLLAPSSKATLRCCAGWAGFFLLLAIVWGLGLSARQASPMLWAGLLIGLGACFWRPDWRGLGLLCLGSLPLALLLWSAFLRASDLLVFSSFGMDAWGYLNAADWLQTHSLSQVPVPGQDAMRYNWTWHVLSTQERPLVYETLACLDAALRQPAHVIYMLLPLSLMSSCLVCVSSHSIGLKKPALGALLLLAGLLAVMHPLVVLTWVAQLFANHVCACLILIAFATLLSHADASPEEQTRSAAWALVLLLCCGGLYARQLLPFAWVCAGLPLVLSLVWRPASQKGRGLELLGRMPWLPLLAALGLTSLTLAKTLPIGSAVTTTGKTGDLLGQYLSGFGGVSPFGWYGYLPITRDAYQPGPNPLGLACAILLLGLLAWLCWRRWKAASDLRLPILLLCVAGTLIKASGDHNLLTRVMSLFVPGLLVGAGLCALEERAWPSRVLGLLLLILPALRSEEEIRIHLQGEVLAWHSQDQAPADGLTTWTMLAFLHFHEDERGYDWRAHPEHYHSITHFLPLDMRTRLKALHHMESPSESKQATPPAPALKP